MEMSKTRKFNIIAAVCENNGIGINGRLPWSLKREMNYFTAITSNACEGKRNAVVMGRKTWESIPNRYRPLANRVNVVLSRTASELPFGAHLMFASLSESLSALTTLASDPNDADIYADIDAVFVIGGESLYKEAIRLKECDKVYLTRIYKHFECDTFFPEVDLNFYKAITEQQVPQQIQEEAGIEYQFFVYQRL